MTSNTRERIVPPETPPQAVPVPTRSLASRLANGAAVMVALTTVASATNYASTLVFSRLLEPARFGDLTALLALSVVLAVPTGAAQTLLAERVAVLTSEARPGDVRWLIRYAFGHVFTLAVIATAIYAATIPLVTSALDLEGPGPAIALVPLVFTSFLLPVVFGVLQGMDRFVGLGLALLLCAVSRIVLGVPLVELTGGAGGALAGQALGNLLVIGLAAWLGRSYLLRGGTGAGRLGARRKLSVATLFAGAAFVAFALLSNLDIVLAKLFLARDEVGLYAALSTLAKVVIFLPGAVAIVMVPNAARARHSEGSSTRVLRVAALLVAVTTALAAVPAALEPSLVIDVMFGDDYSGAESGVLPIVLAGAALAMLYLLVVYSVAIRDRRWVGVLVLGVLLQIIAISLFHDSPEQVATAQAAAVGAVLLINEVFFHPLMHGRGPLLRRGGA